MLAPTPSCKLKRPRKRPRTTSPTSPTNPILTPSPAQHHTTETYLSTLPTRATTAYAAGQKEQALHLCTFALTQPDLSLAVRSQLVDTLALIYLERLEVLVNEAVVLGEKLRTSAASANGLQGVVGELGIAEAGDGVLLDEEEEEGWDGEGGGVLEGESDAGSQERESVREEGYESWTGDEESDDHGRSGSGEKGSGDSVGPVDDEGSVHSIGLVEVKEFHSIDVVVENERPSIAFVAPSQVADSAEAFDDVEAAWALFDEAVVEVAHESNRAVSVDGTKNSQPTPSGKEENNDMDKTPGGSPPTAEKFGKGIPATASAETSEAMVAAKAAQLLSPVLGMCRVPDMLSLAEPNTSQVSEQDVYAEAVRDDQASLQQKVLPSQHNRAVSVATITIPVNHDNLIHVQERETGPFGDRKEHGSTHSDLQEPPTTIQENGNRYLDNNREQDASIDGQTTKPFEEPRADADTADHGAECMTALEPATAQSGIEDLDETRSTRLSEGRLEVSTLSTPSISQPYEQAATPKSSTLLGWSSPAADRYRAILEECRAMRKEYDEEFVSDGRVGGGKVAEAVGAALKGGAESEVESEARREIEEEANGEGVAEVDVDGHAST